MAAVLLWRRVLKATIDTLEGNSRGQYDIRLARPGGIDAFFAGLPRTPTHLGGYTVEVPLAAAESPVAVPEMPLAVAYIGPKSARNDWRVPSQRPANAYPLWRLGTGLLPGTPPGQDYVVFIRDDLDHFHARWLRGKELDALPLALGEAMLARDASVRQLAPPEWRALAKLLKVRATMPAPGRTVRRPTQAGVAYRPEDVTVASKIRDPFSVDPDILDRGLGAHKRTQNAVADLIKAGGSDPLSHRPLIDPPFDVSWRVGTTLNVGEVKSLTRTNEEKQLRLGLGQVLRYVYQLRGDASTIRPVLIAERKPSDPTWWELCQSLGVGLVWGPDFDGLPGL